MQPVRMLFMKNTNHLLANITKCSPPLDKKLLGLNKLVCKFEK